MAAPPRSRRWRKRLLMVAVGGLAALAALEIALRIADPVWLEADEARLFLPHEIWHHERRANVEATLPLPDGTTYDIRTNELGLLHPRPVVVPKPAGTYRVLVLGDSFAEGYDDDTRVSVQIERALARRDPDQAFDVINAAQGSYSPLLHFLRIEAQWHELDPDAILIDVDLTDVYDGYWRYRPDCELDEAGVPVSAHETQVGLRRVAVPLMDASYLVRALARVYKKIRRPVIDDAPLPLAEHIFSCHVADADPDEHRAALDHCVANLDRCIEACRKREIAVMITVHPHRQQIQPDPGEQPWTRVLERRVEKLCAERGVPFFSAFDGIAQAMEEGEEVFWPNDMHFNHLGQRRWGALVSEFFVRVARADAAYPR